MICLFRDYSLHLNGHRSLLFCGSNIMDFEFKYKRIEKQHMSANILTILIFLLVMLTALYLWQKENTKREMNKISSQIVHIENIVSMNKGLIQKLQTHETRLRAVTINMKIYRIPVLIEGKSVYTTMAESELEELSNSLALEDLLEKHHATKGGFRSDDPIAWKRKLVEDSRSAESHLYQDELPAIQTRIVELNKENQELESAKTKLLERQKTI
jgi:hypothetical protein